MKKTVLDCNTVFCVLYMDYSPLKVLSAFYKYQKTGYYPCFFEINNEEVYKMTLEQNLHMTIEQDLAVIYPHFTAATMKKIKQLLIFIASSVPFIPNWTKIMNACDIGDLRTVKNYFKHLEDAGLIRTIARTTEKFNKIEGFDKVFLNNVNQLCAISSSDPGNGTIRETFFLSMLAKGHRVTLPQNGDFLVNEQFVFEIGGRNKSFEQIKSAAFGYLACDDIELGIKNKIPLWLFGFVY